MSENRELNYHGHDENDEESDIIYTPGLHEEDDDRIDDSSDIIKALHKPRKSRDTWDTAKKAIENHELVNMSVGDGVEMINTHDRPANTIVEGTYAGSRSRVINPEDKPGKRIPKAGVCAEAGIGRARAEYSVFEAEAKGPNVSACAEASPVGAGAMARAEIASASAQAGPVGVKVGLGVDTGASVGADGVEVKFLGTGVTIGPKLSVAVLGSEVSCSIM